MDPNRRRAAGGRVAGGPDGPGPLRTAALAGLALALAALGGCGWWRSRPAAAVPSAPPTELFATVDKLTAQVEAIPDKAKRDELLATIEKLRGQLTFGEVKMPPAARLLLAKSIEILPLTRVADWNGDGGADGFELFMEAFDEFGDSTKVVGKLYFELFAYRPAHADRRSLVRSGYWEVNIETADDAARYWNHFGRNYQFNLVWTGVPAVGQKYIFQATYVAPWGEVIETRHILERRGE